MICEAPSVAPTEVPQLESVRLRLRPWREADVSPYAAIIADPAVMRFMGNGLRYRLKRAAAWVVALGSDVEARRAVRKLERRWQRWGFGEWAAEEKASGRLLGRIGFMYHPDWPIGSAKGAGAALDHAFAQLGLERVISIAHLENARSQRVMEKLGMTRQGEVRWRGGDMVWYTIDRDAWLAGREPAAAAAQR